MADQVDGIDLSHRAVGDILDLSQRDGEMLVAEGWALAVPVERNGDRRRALADAMGNSEGLSSKRRS
ncbi:MAG: hypothetical protein ACRD1V_16755 [Vicinamibacterales bacterium]